MTVASSLSRSSASCRVIVVDDAVVVRGLVSKWITEADGMSCVGSYRSVKAALDQFDTVKPQVVILDIEMPEIDGLQAIPMFLQKNPHLVIIMASTLTKRNAKISLTALSKGAKDYVAKPDSNSGLSTSDTFRRELIDKILAFGSVVSGQKMSSPVVVPSSRRFSAVVPRVLTIGSSTGGPQAVQKLLSALGSKIQHFPVLLAQHMPRTFTNIFAEQLAKMLPDVVVKEAQSGDIVRKGVVLIAPGGYHMVVEKSGDAFVVALLDTPPVHFCKPAVDPLFESVAKAFGSAALGVVLTGMGQDGAAGSVKIADAGGSVIAQDEATSVVWGMPGATVRLGAPAAVLPIQDIAPQVLSLFRV